MPSQRRANACLALMGLASAGLYALLAFRYPLVRSLDHPRAGWADLTSASWASVLYHTGIYFGMTVLYVLDLRRMTHLDPSSRHPLIVSSRTALLIITLIWVALPGSPGPSAHHSRGGRSESPYLR